MEAGSLSDIGSPEPSPDFGFAFNEVNFSDRILRIEIFPDLPREKSDPDDGIDVWARNRKRRRCIITKLTEQSEQQIFGCIMRDLDEMYENQEEEVVAMIEEGLGTTQSQPAQEVAQENETSSGTDHSEVQFRTVHVSSPILAAKSPFFYKLFSNGMRESDQRHATIRIQASEEEAVMYLLNFMYSNALSINTPTALLDVLMAADKFEVASCMRYCSRLLRNIPMTRESALLYLDLPSSVLLANTVQPLTDAAKQFLAESFKDLTKSPEDVLSLPLAGIEAVLFSDDLQVSSEDAVYDFVLKWARFHYPKLQQRRDILRNRLLRFVRFPCMSCRKLKKVLSCPDIDSELASKVVLDALFYKADVPHRLPADEDPNSTFHRFIERSYKYRPVKVVVFESPSQQCLVYLDLKREELAQLFPLGRIYSQAFHFGGQGFFLSGHCNAADQMPGGGYNCFGLFLGMQEKGSVAFTVEYEFAARTKPSEEFVSKYKAKYVFTGGKAVGYRNLFSTPWAAFIAEDSPYFINGILHLRAELTARKSS